jgi:hypothetical protein
LQIKRPERDAPAFSSLNAEAYHSGGGVPLKKSLRNQESLAIILVMVVCLFPRSQANGQRSGLTPGAASAGYAGDDCLPLMPCGSVRFLSPDGALSHIYGAGP